MDYKFEDCTHHNMCLYYELTTQLGFMQCFNIRRKVKEFEASKKDKLYSFYPNRETIFMGSVGEGFRHWKTDQDSIIVLKDITVLDYDSEIIYSREPNRKTILSISNDLAFLEEGYVQLKYRNDGSDSLSLHTQCINHAKNEFVSSYRFREW